MQFFLFFFSERRYLHPIVFFVSLLKPFFRCVGLDSNQKHGITDSPAYETGVLPITLPRNVD
jgi:hypothetical protein